MPYKEGRSGIPGNTTTYRPVHITVANPALLQSGTNRGSVSPKQSSNSVTSEKKVEKSNQKSKLGLGY
jgi:hypothetical protein